MPPAIQRKRRSKMIKILADSASDFTLSEAEELGLELNPIQVRFDDEEYLDGVTITKRQFFEKLIESATLPQTSQINEKRWEEKFEEMTKSVDEVIAITISSKLSGTYQSAARASKKFAGKVFAVDSMNASIGERILCLYALNLVKSGISAGEIVKELNAVKTKIQVLAALDTLKYLKKGGRISSVTAFTGELLSIKPVIAIIGGEVKLAGKAVGSKKSNNLLVQLVNKCGGIDFKMPFVVGYSGFNDDCLQKYLKDSEALWKGETDTVPVSMIGSTIGTHIGPGAVAVAFFAK
ncbi:MAG: DegV family protein [Clostridia bacterium]|nr:DegV family protein [Clostridia bacterium]